MTEKTITTTHEEARAIIKRTEKNNFRLLHYDNIDGKAVLTFTDSPNIRQARRSLTQTQFLRELASQTDVNLV